VSIRRGSHFEVDLSSSFRCANYKPYIETISIYGADAFYTGAIANATITALQAHNGTMTLQDLKNYSIAIRKPAQITYRKFKLTACSAPSSGEVALSVMKTVEGYQGFGEEAMLNLSTQRLDEAIRFGYGEVIHYPFQVKSAKVYLTDYPYVESKPG